MENPQEKFLFYLVCFTLLATGFMMLCLGVAFLVEVFK